MVKNLQIQLRWCLLAFLTLASFISAKAQSFTEDFNDISTLAGSGWVIQNNSAPLGSLSWFQGTATNSTPTPGPFNAYNGANNAYIAVNFNSVGSTGTISNWLIMPNRTLRNGDVFTFYTRKPTIGPGMTDYPDRLEVRLSSNGASTNVGAAAASVGDFTTLLLSVNPTLVGGVYPQTWTQYTITISGLSAPTSGRMAFRYFVTGGGSLGTNSDYIGIDNVVYTPYVCPTLTISPSLAALPNATYNSAYSTSFNQTGALGAPKYSIVAGSLPAGLTLSQSGVISGTPTVSGSFNFTVQVADNSGCSTSKAYSLEVFAVQDVDLSVLNNKKYGDADFDLPENSSAGFPISYTSNNPSVATVTGRTVSIIAAGSAKITATHPGNAIYLPLNKEETFTVGKAILTATPASQQKTYDGQVYGGGYGITYSGFVLGEDEAAAAISGNIAYTGTSQTATQVGAYPIAVDVSGLSAANYSIQAGPNAQLTISKRDINGTFIASNKIYDGNNTAVIFSATVTPLAVDNGKLSLTGGTASFDDENVGNAKNVTASGMVLSGDAAGNYNLVSVANASANITPKVLTVTATGINKVYDATAVATVNLTDDRIVGDVLTVSYGAASFDSKHVGTAKAVSVTGISISGADANNYSVSTTANATANITKKALLVSATGNHKVYDGNTTATVNLSDDRIAGDVLTATYSNATFNNKDVGTAKAVSVTGISISGADAANYSVNTTANTSANITAKALLVSATGINKVYDGNNTATVNLTDNRVVGDVLTATYSAAAFNNKQVGTAKAVSVTGISISGTNAGNYSVNTTANTTANITAKALLVSAVGINKVYDATITATVNLSDDRIAGDVLTSSYSAATFDNKNVGNGKAVAVTGINISGTDAANYTINTTASTSANITRKALTIIADNKEKFEGTVNPLLTISYSGFVSGENNTVLSTQPSITTTATLTSTQGDYPITVSGAVAQNYTITYQNGILTVKPGAPTSISLAATTLYENRAAGTQAGTLSSTSDSPTATFTYSLVSGSGDTDNASFSISGDRLLTALSLDYETKQSYSVRVRSTTQFGFSLDRVFTVQLNDVNEAPTLSAISNQAICYTTAEQSIPLTGITAGPETTQTTTVTALSGTSGLLSSITVVNNQLRYRIAPGQSGTSTITVTVKDNGGTANGGVDTFVRTFTLTINPLPVIAISSSKGASLSKGETAVLSATSNNGVNYVWSNAAGIVSGQNSASLTVRPLQTTTYTVTATSASGCVSTAMFTIEVKDDFMALQAENFITPNGDGKNDTWVVHNIDAYPNHSLIIVDRAGRVVYEARNYKNDWDGTFKGAALQHGTYYYIFRFENQAIASKKGFITIVRSDQ